jgi:hypothetical protein
MKDFHEETHKTVTRIYGGPFGPCDSGRKPSGGGRRKQSFAYKVFYDLDVTAAVSKEVSGLARSLKQTSELVRPIAKVTLCSEADSLYALLQLTTQLLLTAGVSNVRPVT